MVDIPPSGHDFLLGAIMMKTGMRRLTVTKEDLDALNNYTLNRSYNPITCEAVFVLMDATTDETHKKIITDLNDPNNPSRN